MAYEGGDFRNEMVGDLLELAASNKCCGDFRRLSGDAVGKRKNAEEMSEKEKRRGGAKCWTSIPQPSYS